MKTNGKILQGDCIVEMREMETNKIIQGDAKEVLKQLPNESVDMAMTSPPYWGLRDYGEEAGSLWGGDKDCVHSWKRHKVEPSSGSPSDKSGLREDPKKKQKENWSKGIESEEVEVNFCSKCGAWKGQLGLEPKPDLYVKHLMSIFDELKKVLKPTGLFFLNIGDTYSDSGGAPEDTGKRSYDKGSFRNGTVKTNLPQKCMSMIPERVMMSMVDRGWILRNKIIWNKPNPMPESVKDRFSTGYEFIYMFSKQKRYYFDLDAVREPYSEATKKRHEYAKRVDETYGENTNQKREDVDFRPQNKQVRKGRKSIQQQMDLNKGKNPGDVFEVTTQPFPDAHFAVYPPELCEKPIKAGCPQKVCVECGTPYEREVERKGGPSGDHLKHAEESEHQKAHEDNRGSNTASGSTLAERYRKEGYPTRVHKGWQKKCDCPTEQTKPGIVLDPFAGAGTTCLKASELGRRYIGIEISEKYAEMARERVGKGRNSKITEFNGG